MRKFSPLRGYGAATALLGILGAQVVALADEPATGELWRGSTTMEMPGMTMPSRPIEQCVAPGKEDEALSKPQFPGMGGNCSLQDQKREGNKFTATFVCTGKNAMQGTVEILHEADHSVITFSMPMQGQQITMKTDLQKIGTPCTPKPIPGAH